MTRLQVATAILYACVIVGAVPMLVVWSPAAPQTPFLWGAWCFIMGAGQGDNWSGFMDDWPRWTRMAATFATPCLIGAVPAAGLADGQWPVLFFGGIACNVAGYLSACSRGWN